MTSWKKIALTLVMIAFACPSDAQIFEYPLPSNLVTGAIEGRVFKEPSDSPQKILHPEPPPPPVQPMERQFSVALLSLSPVSRDAEVIPMLCGLTKDKEELIRFRAAQGLGNLARVENDATYRVHGGIMKTREVRERVIACLLPLLNDGHSDVAIMALESLGNMVATDPGVIDALIVVMGRKQFDRYQSEFYPERPVAFSSRVIDEIVKLAGSARDRDLVSWLPTLTRAREAIKAVVREDNGVSVYADDLQRRLDGAIVSLQRKTSIDDVKFWSVVCGGIVIGLHALIFAALTVAARRHAWAFELLFDPVFSKVSAYFYPLLRYYWPIQAWFLQRFFIFRRAQLSGPPRPYLQMRVTRNETGEVLSSGELQRHWTVSKRIWIVGATGMGKTAFVRELDRLFFCNRSDEALVDAVRRQQIMPIAVAARDFGDIAIPANPEEWLLLVAQHALAAAGMRIEDKGILRSVLSSGKLGLVIDGLNEVDRDEAVLKFANANRTTPVLVTSQRPPPSTHEAIFEVFYLPSDPEEYLEQFFKLYLGAEKGGSVAVLARANGLIKEIKSGYEAILIIDLSKRAGPLQLPTSRTALYEAFLKVLRLPTGPYPIGDLEALAWDMMKKGLRRFDSKVLDPDLIYPLLASGSRILRRVAGDRYEFRHDQMRAYLAARYLASENSGVLEEWLVDCPIWNQRSKEDQDPMWEFFATMISESDTAQSLWRFASEKRVRYSLREALEDRASRSGWALTLLPRTVAP